MGHVIQVLLIGGGESGVIKCDLSHVFILTISLKPVEDIRFGDMGKN